MEEWREVYGFDVLYEISNTGKLRTKHHGKKGYTSEYRNISPLDNGNGYLRVNLRLNRKQKTVYIHKLVAQAFVPNPKSLTEVNHIDENKQNNNAENLEWCTHFYNCQYGTRNKRTGEKRAKKILCVELNIIYNSLIEASQKLNIGKTAISNCLKGRSKTSGGYSWRYVDV